ncbi:single-strand DNA endonuclease ASTE1 [Ambystoma mexicanum]|uniref:single-strand DNA endonuclease ASTE1 n=1 Tax=Ambystoma mexicanum TaxID=8296 RepID=UPI0037E7F276
MGVHGLMSYVRANNQFFDHLKLRETRIIIDGSNLFHRLYFDFSLDLQHGGDYDAFAAVVHKFFDALAACAIQPYVVLDGGCDPSDKKLDTLKQRARDKINMAHSLSKGRGGTVLPLLIREVFRQVLDELKVPSVQCFSEADGEIVALANQWKCPVLTYDSDFCIFDLIAGYCPITEFQWQNIGTLKGTGESYIPAKCFLVEKLCIHFSHMNKAILPLFAVLNGNDYVNTPALAAFFRKVNFPIGACNSNCKKHVRIQGLLNWLSGFTDPTEALESVVKHLKTQEQNSIRELLSTSMQEYKPANVKLEDFFQNGLYICDTEVKFDFPDWFLGALARGQLAPFLSDVLVLRKIFLFVQVENMQRPSAHKVSQPIRKAIYRLLLNSYPRDAQGSLNNKQSSTLCVHEFDRTEQTLRKAVVEVTIEASGSFQDTFFVNELSEAALSEHRKLLLEVLEVELSAEDPLTPCWMLPVAITSYWVRYCEPKVKLHHLHALVMAMVCGELQSVTSRAVDVNVHGEQAKAVHVEFLKLKERKGQNKQLDVDTAHIFSQWQSCLQMGLYLNQLLRFPLPVPDLARLYSGTLVHRLCHEFKTSPATKDLLTKCPSMEELYQKLLCAVKSAVPPDFFQNKSSCKSNKSRKKR